MKRFLEIIKMMFTFHHYTITNKFHVGDVVLWPHECDSCMDVIGEITNWWKVWDRDENREYIVYDIRDIHRGYEYGDIEEKYVQLLATAEEIREVNSPYTNEIEFKEYIKQEYGY